MESNQSRRDRGRTRREGVVRTKYTDDEGQTFTVEVPPGREAMASMGVVVGPPDLSALGLPDEVRVRLNNQLYNRGLITRADVRRHPESVAAALMAALKVNATQVSNLYLAPMEDKNG